MEHYADVIIVGTGVAGLFCALQLPESQSVLLVTKDKAEHSDSYLAQGGISVLRAPEDYDSYFTDTMRAGRNRNNPESVEVMIRSSPEIVQDLIALGVEFDRAGNALSYTREGAHSAFRILHHKDITGQEITSKLLAQVRKRQNIRLREYTAMLDITEENGSCTGIIVKTKAGMIQPVFAQNVVLATGGMGGLFRTSTNYGHITGDAVAIALRHGIALEDLQYIQIHPTVFYTQEPGRRFLISESVRGEGAILLNQHRDRFVDELLPRDAVTAAILGEMERTGAKFVQLSMGHMGAQRIKERFPNIYAYCLAQGYDITKEPIPVEPAQHYCMGGIAVNINGETSMKHVYAIGETACNGVHGANRLASNSLLESLVFAKRAAQKIASQRARVLQPQPVDLTQYEDWKALQQAYAQSIWSEIKRRDGTFYAKWSGNENRSG